MKLHTRGERAWRLYSMLSLSALVKIYTSLIIYIGADGELTTNIASIFTLIFFLSQSIRSSVALLLRDSKVLGAPIVVKILVSFIAPAITIIILNEKGHVLIVNLPKPESTLALCPQI